MLAYHYKAGHSYCVNTIGLYDTIRLGIPKSYKMSAAPNVSNHIGAGIHHPYREVREELRIRRELRIVCPNSNSLATSFYSTGHYFRATTNSGRDADS